MGDGALVEFARACARRLSTARITKGEQSCPHHRHRLRRDFLAVSAAAGTAGLIPASVRAAASDLHPALQHQCSGRGTGRSPPPPGGDRWPERETVTDQSQGVQLATIQELTRYWATDYD